MVNVVVVGVGGVGGYIGARLLQAGANVQFLVRKSKDSDSHSLSNGLKLESICGDVSFDKVKCSWDVNQIEGPIDVIIIAVKTFQVLFSKFQPLTD
jgi:2-dehydropantoate 2-reductase